MISQTDSTLSPAQTTTNPLSNHHPSRSTTAAIHNGKGSKGFNLKKRKKYDETIIDGFAIIAFKTWEDLQDELNDRSSNTTAANNTNNNNNNTNNNANNNSNNNNDTNCTADKKANSKSSKQKSSSTTSSSVTGGTLDSTNLMNTSKTKSLLNTSKTKATTNTTNSSLREKDGGKKKEKAKKSAGHPQLAKESKDKQRNKTSSSEKNTLKRALEAKELAEKRLSILQEKLKQEQSKNRNHNVNHNTTSIVPDHHYPSPQTPTIIKEELLHVRANGILGQDLLKDPNPTLKPAPYSPFHTNSHLHRPNSAIHHPIQQQQQLHTPPPPPRMHLSQTQTPQSQHQLPKHSSHPLQHPHQSHSPPTSLMHQQPSSPPPPVHQQIHPQYQRQPPPQYSTPQSHQHLPQAQHQQPQMNPYSHQPPSNPMMSPMSLGSLPSPYTCPPSIYITDTISRQTSIIPPPLGPALEQTTPPVAASSRYGHSSVLHSITPYNPAVPSHHPMYYPTLPTERSFIELARSYIGPGHLGYPNFMNSFPTPTPSITANPYDFDRWPRVALDHQRAVSRYNSLYQSTAALPDRATYASYTSTRPPTFPAGLFPPRF